MLTYYKHPSQFGNIFIYWKRSKLYSFNYNNSLSLLFLVNIFLVLFPLLLYETTFLRKVENLYPITALICQERCRRYWARVHFQTLQTQSKAQFHDSFQFIYSPQPNFYFSLVVNIQIQGEAFFRGIYSVWHKSQIKSLYVL